MSCPHRADTLETMPTPSGNAMLDWLGHHRRCRICGPSHARGSELCLWDDWYEPDFERRPCVLGNYLFNRWVRLALEVVNGGPSRRPPPPKPKMRSLVVGKHLRRIQDAP